MAKKVLVTCPPMLASFDFFRERFASLGYEVETPSVTQTMSEEELMALVPGFDGWIIGDDPATERVFQAGRAGCLKAAVKWGVGVDNVDFKACERLGIPVINTPQMFGREVADVAMGYVIGLARETFWIDSEVKRGKWPKPVGISLAGKRVASVGFGDIGRASARRLLASEMEVVAYDPFFDPKTAASAVLKGVEAVDFATWPEGLESADYLIFTCALSQSSYRMLNASTLGRCKRGVRVVNVARGPLIDESALIAALESGQVHSAALDVFETEPLPLDSPLRKHPRCIFGSHNASNTIEAVIRTSERAIALLDGFLKNGRLEIVADPVDPASRAVTLEDAVSL